MQRIIGFISAAMLCLAGTTGQFGLVSYSPTPSPQALPDFSGLRLLAPVETEPECKVAFDPTVIVETEQIAISQPTAAEEKPEVAFDPTVIGPQPKPDDVKPVNPNVVPVVEPITGKTVTGPTIIMLTTPGCSHCVRWWEGEAMPGGGRKLSMRQQFADKGWTVTPHTGGASRYPTFLLYDGKQWHRHVGFMTGADARRLLGGSAPPTPQAKPTAAAYSPVSLYAPEYTIGGRPWTAASLRQHLYSHSNHRYPAGSLDSLSLSELQQIHNTEHHYGKAAVVSVNARVNEAVSYAASSYCPTCPQTSTYSQTGIFRLRAR